VEIYWRKHKNDARPAQEDLNDTANGDSLLSEYERHRQKLLQDGRSKEEGWGPELRRYLGIIELGTNKNMDIVEWWQVRYQGLSHSFSPINNHRTIVTYIQHSQKLRWT
jgi:hypothetical protein